MVSNEEARFIREAKRQERNARNGKRMFRSVLVSIAWIAIVSWPYLFTSAESQCDGSPMNGWILLYDIVIIVPLAATLKYGKWFFGYSCLQVAFFSLMIFIFIGIGFSCS